MVDLIKVKMCFHCLKYKDNLIKTCVNIAVKFHNTSLYEIYFGILSQSSNTLSLMNLTFAKKCMNLYLKFVNKF